MRCIDVIQGATIPSVRSGCVALFEIATPDDVMAAALRHQLEGDDH